MLDQVHVIRSEFSYQVDVILPQFRIGLNGVKQDGIIQKPQRVIYPDIGIFPYRFPQLRVGRQPQYDF